MNHSDRIDNLIRTRIRRLRGPAEIEPSADFMRRVMRGACRLERRHQATRDLWVLFLALFPVGFREVWFAWARGDYFSLGQWPLGSMLVRAYGIFMSQLGVTLLLGLSVVVFVGYLLKFRRPVPLYREA